MFVTDVRKIKHLVQTSNLGARSSNSSGAPTKSTILANTLQATKHAGLTCRRARGPTIRPKPLAKKGPAHERNSQRARLPCPPLFGYGHQAKRIVSEAFKPNLHLATTPAMLDPLSRVGRASLMSATSIALRPQRGVPVIGSGMMPRRTQSQSRTANRSRSIRPLGA